MTYENLKIDISCCLDLNNSKIEEHYNTNRTPINWLVFESASDKDSDLPKWINYLPNNKYRGFCFSNLENKLTIENIEGTIDKYIQILNLKDEYTRENVLNYINFIESYIHINFEIKKYLMNKYNLLKDH